MFLLKSMKVCNNILTPNYKHIGIDIDRLYPFQSTGSV